MTPAATETQITQMQDTFIQGEPSTVGPSFLRPQEGLRRSFLRPNMALVRGRAVVNFNNQSTILLRLQIDETTLVLLHDNRLFCFSLEERHVQARDGSSQLQPKPSADELAQNILLRLQASLKYRLLDSLFLSFRLTDNLMLLTMIVLTVLKHGKFTYPDRNQIAVYSAIGVELFYDVLLMTSKFWFLERRSPYVGLGDLKPDLEYSTKLVLYLMYFTIVYILKSPLYVWYVLLIRLAAFLSEESVDIAMDLEMHNDLIHICDNWPAAAEELPYMDVRRSLLDFPYWPRPEFFIGSGSAWLTKSAFNARAFNAQTYRRRPFSRLCFWWLYGVPMMVYLPLAVVIGVLWQYRLAFA